MTYEEHDQLFKDYDQHRVVGQRHGYGVVLVGSDGNGELSSGEDHEQAHIEVLGLPLESDPIAYRRQEITETIWQMNMAPQPGDNELYAQLMTEDMTLEAMQALEKEPELRDPEVVKMIGEVTLDGLERFADWLDHAVDVDSDTHSVTVDDVLESVMPAVSAELTEHGVRSGGSMSPTYALAQLALRV